jgi:hypothetical protein
MKAKAMRAVVFPDRAQEVNGKNVACCLTARFCMGVLSPVLPGQEVRRALSLPTTLALVRRFTSATLTEM